MKQTHISKHEMWGPLASQKPHPLQRTRKGGPPARIPLYVFSNHQASRYFSYL